jgi:hypothetical protein
MQSKYDFHWHVRHRCRNAHSASRIADILLQAVPARSVVDFGCGDGVWLSAFQARGVERIVGYDGPWNDPADLLIDAAHFRSVDLTDRVAPGEAFELALCLEVAEHLPAAAAPTLVASICAHAPVVLFGAAIPNQGGYRHVNERWQSHWSALFAERGFRRFDLVRPQVWDDPEVYFWYKQNVAVFAREDRPNFIAALARATEAVPPMPVDVVHPELFASVANYHQIAFRPLSRQLVPLALRKLRAMLAGRA